MKYPSLKSSDINRRYEDAAALYNNWEIDVDKALKKLDGINLSLHCWQGDDVGGFEVKKGAPGGGIMATGAFPGKARCADELRDDLDKAFTLIPGKKRLNLHAIYLESDGKFVERDEIGAEHFAGWIDWAISEKVKLDFNPTFFAHPKAESGFTLSNADKSIRKFWIDHGIKCRKIAAEFAKKLKDTCVINFWVPDGLKDYPADRWSPRERLAESLDEIFKTDLHGIKDAVEGKLFGLGSEEYVVGSNEFYMAYAISRKKLPCLDMGHYHPTETVHDKLSALLTFIPELLLHVSRPMRWDSDHVVIMNDDLLNLARELVRGNALDKVFLATDFFDGSINRLGAWTIGARSFKKALLYAMLEPVPLLKKLEKDGCGAEKLAIMEEFKGMPFGAIWDFYCMKSDVPVGASWLNFMCDYEKSVLSKRS